MRHGEEIKSLTESLKGIGIVEEAENKSIDVTMTLSGFQFGFSDKNSDKENKIEFLKMLRKDLASNGAQLYADDRNVKIMFN